MLWKGVLEQVFEDLLRFVFPDVDAEFDLQRGVLFLDKELGEMYPEPYQATSTRVVDKLIKVYRRDGQERWMLIHLEVQGDSGKDFARRMFTYYYRILDRFNQPVTAIAIFTGRNRANMQSKFEDHCLGTHILYQYNIINIRDYPDELLINNENPFALVMLVAKSVLLSGKDLDNKLLEQKILILNLLLERGLMRDPKINEIFIFLNNYILFKKKEINLTFMQQVDQLTGKTNTMSVIEILAQQKAEEALEKGRVEEREKNVKSLLASSKFSVKEIASLLGVSQYFVAKQKRSLQLK